MCAIMCLEVCFLLYKGTCKLNSMHILGAWCGRNFCSVGECLPSLPKPDNGFGDLCHSLADSTFSGFLCECVAKANLWE